VLDGLDQRLGHVPVFRTRGVLNKIQELRAATVTDPIPGGGLVFEMLRDEKELLVQAAQQLLGENPHELGCQEGRRVFPLCRRKNPVQAFHRFRSAAGMEGGQDQVSCFCRLKCGAGGSGIPDLAKEDDIGSLAEGSAKALGEGWGVGADLTLSEVRKTVGEEVFDRILDGHDMQGEVLIQPFQASSYGSGFSSSGGTGEKDQPGGALKPFLEDFEGQSQFLHGGDLGGDSPQNRTAETELAMKVDAETDAFLGDITSIVVLGLGRSAAPGPKIFHPGGLQGWNLHGADDLPQPNLWNRIFTQQKISATKVPAGPAEVLNLIHVRRPL